MSLRYSIYDNPFRKKEYMASVCPRRIFTLEDLAQRNPGKRLKAMAEGMKTQKAFPSNPRPQINQVHDLVQDCKNTALTIGQPVKLHGIHLKLDETDAQQGIFLISEEKQTFPITKVFHNTPTRLFFQVPEQLAPGTYKLEVRAKVGNSTELRKGMYPNPLTLSTLR